MCVYLEGQGKINVRPTKGGQGGVVVKRPPGNQKVGGSKPTTATCQEKRKMDIGIAPCTEGAPVVHQDLSGRPADQKLN